MRLRRGLRSGETGAEERLPPCDGLQGLASVASASVDQCNVAARSANERQGWASGGAGVTIHHHGSTTLNNELILLIRTSKFTQPKTQIIW